MYVWFHSPVQLIYYITSQPALLRVLDVPPRLNVPRSQSLRKLIRGECVYRLYTHARRLLLFVYCIKFSNHKKMCATKKLEIGMV